jgi:hypothetical protein
MTPDQRNPRWTAYPLRADQQVQRGHRVSRVHLLGIPAAVGALVLGVGAGSAYAYLTSHGSGTGSGSVGSAAAVTVTATSGTADLVPGGTGAAYFTLKNINNPFGVTFNTVTAASVVSNNTGSCPSSNISIAPSSLPYTFSPAVTVGASTTSGTESIPNLVKLSSSAPGTCQGVTFKVTLTLSGQQS